MIKKIVMAAVCSAVLLLTGCAGMVAALMDKENMLGPDEGVLVYGCGEDSGTYRGSGVLYCQMDEKYPPGQIKPPPFALLYFEPLPPGGSYKLICYTQSINRTYITYYKGIQWFDPDADFKVPDEPGLYFRGVSKRLNATELDILKMLVKVFKDTDWEPVIRARVEEIENEVE